jgi:hypothetical protein
MTPEFAPVVAGALFLVVAGAGKVRRPAGAAGALTSVGIRVGRPVIRAMGAAEVALGVTALAVGGVVPTLLVGLSYIGFTGFVVVALRTGGALSSCGCLGRPDTPPTITHAVVTAALGVTTLVAAGSGGVDSGHLSASGADVALLLFTALVTWLLWLAFAVLPHARVPRLEER